MRAFLSERGRRGSDTVAELAARGYTAAMYGTAMSLYAELATDEARRILGEVEPCPRPDSRIYSHLHVATRKLGHQERAALAEGLAAKIAAGAFDCSA